MIIGKQPRPVTEVEHPPRCFLLLLQLKSKVDNILVTETTVY
jgi:hypothetical protein